MRLQAAICTVLATPCLAQPAPDAAPIESVIVVARRLDTARSQIEPSLGATITTFSPAALRTLPQGANAPLNQVLLQAPGVAQDSFGQIHVRGDHNEVQYRLDGVELPEGFSVFSQALESRFAHSVGFITGALPAQYGMLQAAVVDIAAKSGITDPGGEISVYGGARDLFQPSISDGGSAGKWDWFVTADAVHNRVGIENPTSSFNPIHDLSNQYHGLAHVDYTVDAATRIGLIAGVSNAQFQIPNNPDQHPSLGLNVDGVTDFTSANLNEHQREITNFAILSLQQHFATIDVQSSLFSRYSSLYFTPDPLGDLLFSGIAQTAARSIWSSGMQTDASWRVAADHTVRAGWQVTGERSVSATRSQVLPLDAGGTQSSDQPLTITDDSGRTGGVYGAYIQDEWRLLPWATLNIGGRFDAVDEYTHENQFSPRVNLVIRATPTTTLHAGYAHYFTPPPFELIGGNTVNLFAGTTEAAPVTTDDTVKAEHDTYFDAGIDQIILPGLRVGLDTYYKSARNLIDEGQFGAPIILTAFNYRHGKVDGTEFSFNDDHGPWSLYGNLAYARAIGKQIDSAQFEFSANDLAYIAQHYIHLDHDQRWTSSAGIAYTLDRTTPQATHLAADYTQGSGLRADGATPNGQPLHGYYVVSLGLTQNLDAARLHGVQLRLDVLNLLDRRYEIRDGSGIGVGAPQFGLRRSIYAGISKTF